MDLQLDRVRRVLHRMSFVRPRWVVTVAGTNGKGSTIAVLESIYREAGFRVGAYTSPHLVNYCERFRIDGKDADETQLLTAFAKVEKARSGISLTYFEYSTLVALSLFQAGQVQIALLEIGLGGRADAVNAITPDIACITSIALDHEAWLGTNREEIGYEKAGIIRYRGRVVVNDPAPPNSVLDRSSLLGCSLRRVGVDYRFSSSNQEWCWDADPKFWTSARSYSHLPLPSISGPLAVYHAAGALAVVESMQLSPSVSVKAIRSGLTRVALRGRIQVLRGAVEQVFDVAHNPAAVENLLAFLVQRPVVTRTHVVFSMLMDKDVVSVVKMISPIVDSWHLAELDGERAMPMGELLNVVATYASGLVLSYSDAVAAYRGGLSQARPGERLIVFGSFLLVGAILSDTESEPTPA
jgi:dihydrofolate synthase/folylpolyglutamate synthase